MKRIAFDRPVLSLILLVTAGCGLALENPVDRSSGEEVPIEDFLGDWHVIELFGEPIDPPMKVAMQASEQGIIVEGGADEAKEGFLRSLQSLTYLFVREDPKTWRILNLSFSGEELHARSLRLDSLKRDVEQGRIAGSSETLDIDYVFVRITASPQALESYLQSSEIALEPAFAKLRRVQQP